MAAKMMIRNLLSFMARFAGKWQIKIKPIFSQLRLKWVFFKKEQNK
jgi:tRNA G26 N,N-dimethylase Trm1